MQSKNRCGGEEEGDGEEEREWEVKGDSEGGR
jgi:hypothetical protein